MPIREKNGKWHYRFQHLGKPCTGSTGLEATERNRKSAERAELEARLRVEGGQPSKTKRIVFDDASKQFLDHCRVKHKAKPNTHKRITGSFTTLRAYFSGRSVAGLTDGDVVNYRTWRTNEHKVEDVTVRHDLHALSKFMKFAIKQAWRRDNPVKAEDIPSDAEAVRINPLSPHQECLYLLQAQRWPKLYDLTTLMIEQGCRPEELLSVEWEDIDMVRGYIRVEGKSAAAKRTLKLTETSMSIIAARLKGQWLFTSERNPSQKLSLSTVENWHVKARAASKVECVIYDMRHTFATRKAASGTSLATLAKLLGHGSLRSVMKYVHPDQDEMDRAMMENWPKTGPEDKKPS